MVKKFKFNAGSSLLFLVSGDTWKQSLESAFEKLFSHHKDFYYDGSAPSVTEITSKKFVESTFRLYFYDYKEHSDFLSQEWANKVLSFSEEPQKSTKYINKMDSIIPSYLVKRKISKANYKALRTNFRWLLFCLWNENAILLPVTYSFPRSWRKNAWVEPFFNLYPELMQLLRAPYNINVNVGVNVAEHLKKMGIPNEQIRDYGYKLITASTWRNIEDVSITDARYMLEELRSAINNNQTSYRNHLPVIPLLKLIVSIAPDKCAFDIPKIIDFQKERIAVSEPLNQMATSNNQCIELDIWLQLQAEFIYLLEDSGRSAGNKKDYQATFTAFNKHLFTENITQIREEKITPLPNQYSRRIFTGSGHFISFKSRFSIYDPNTVRQHINRLNTFFNWLDVNSHDKNIKGFKNPIHELDSPKTYQSKGTNKKIPPSRVFTQLYSFVATICDFYWWLIENDKYVAGIANTKSNYDTQELGMTPIVWIEGKPLPIYYIPTRLTTEATATKQEELYKYPVIQCLFAIFVALETGLRTTHICWLSIDEFDAESKNQWNSLEDLNIIFELEFEATQLLVSSDKVKRSAWSPYVSTRVIRMLKRLKYFLSKIDGDIPSLWYNDAINGPFGKIRSIFHLKEASGKSQNPITWDSVSNQFKRIQCFFDLWQITHSPLWESNNLESDFVSQLNQLPQKLDTIIQIHSENNSPPNKILAECFYYCASYETQYTPHGIRSSVISENIKILPPNIIAEHMSGHDSMAVFSHYVQLDPEYMRDIGNIANQKILDGELSLNNLQTNNTFKNELITKKLKEVVEKNPNAIQEDLGGISFSAETSPEQFHSGLADIKASILSDAAYFPTHICPFNGKCPSFVLQTFGEFNCGQCSASIKTVDHIPRILAHIRHLNTELDSKTSHIKDSLKLGADKSAMHKLDKERIDLAMEVAAWVVTYNVLEDNLKSLENKNKFIVCQPELIKEHFTKQESLPTKTSEFLLRLMDVEMFEEYFTPNLKAQITSVRHKILAKKGDFTAILNQPDDYTMLDEVRGLISSYCQLESISLHEAVSSLLEPMKTPSIQLLGIKQ